MNADTSEDMAAPAEEHFTSLLIACDEALAAGAPARALTDAAAAIDLRPRLERGVACLHLLGHYWAAQSTTVAAAVATAAEPANTEPLTRLGRFHIRRQLGQGSFGAVYLAHDPLLGREVALEDPACPRC